GLGKRDCANRRSFHKQNHSYENHRNSSPSNRDCAGATARPNIPKYDAKSGGDAADSTRRRRSSRRRSNGTRKRTPPVESRDGKAERSSAAAGRDDLSRGGPVRAAIQRIFQS